jgi:hypothetical protein
MSFMEYVLRRTSRSRAIRISLNHEGEVIVTAPKFVLGFMIEQFVKQNEPWITRQQQRLVLKKSVSPTLNWEEGVISYIGTLYYIKFRDSGGKVSFENGVCWVHPVTSLESDVKTTLLRWLKMYAEKDIATRTNEWAKTMGVKFGSVRFGQQVSRWGSCTGEGNLRFNWRLIHFPSDVIDYVVIHELSHTVHHDHSDRFWSLVEKYCPSWKEQRKYLKRQMVSKED